MANPELRQPEKRSPFSSFYLIQRNRSILYCELTHEVSSVARCTLSMWNPGVNCDMLSYHSGVTVLLIYMILCAWYEGTHWLAHSTSGSLSHRSMLCSNSILHTVCTIYYTLWHTVLTVSIQEMSILYCYTRNNTICALPVTSSQTPQTESKMFF